mgnify:CR=1 FL=1
MTGPAIPYLGTFFTDITFIEDGNSTRGKDDRINYHFKCLKIYSLIQNALQFQKDEYNFEVHESILAQMHREFTKCKQLTEDEVYFKSIDLEKSGPSMFKFPKIGDEEVLAEIRSYNNVEIFRAFTGPDIIKKSGLLQKIGASDYIHAKTGHRMARKKKTVDISGYATQRNNSRLLLNEITDDMIADSNNQELVVHMKVFHTGIPLAARSHRGIREEYFLASTLIEWLSKNLSDSSRFRAIEIAQGLFDDGYIVGLDTDDARQTWINKPFLKLKFKENYSVMDVMAQANSGTSMLDSSFADISETFDCNSSTELFSDESESPSVGPMDLNTPSLRSDNVLDWDESHLEELANRMKHPKSGLKIKTRKWLLKRFPNCFVGEQAVTWLCYHLDMTDRKQAVAIGIRMQNHGLFRHVTNDHMFQDKYLFFRFTDT